MMILVPYKPDHLQNLLLQPEQAYFRPFLSDPEYAKALMIPGKSFTAMDGDRVLGCGGIVPYWENRGEIWSLLSPNLRKDFVALHYATKRFLKVCGFRRVEAHVDADFCKAKAWIELLGFQFEGIERAYTPDGRDSLRYAFINQEAI